jgi:uncharacterized protein
MKNLIGLPLTSCASFISSSGRTVPVTPTMFCSVSPPVKYILRYDYIPDVLEKRGPYREEHLKLAKELCMSGGPSSPLGSDVPTGALFIFADTEKADAFVKQDPYVTGGIVTKYTLEAWTVAIIN